MPRKNEKKAQGEANPEQEQLPAQVILATYVGVLRGELYSSLFDIEYNPLAFIIAFLLYICVEGEWLPGEGGYHPSPWIQQPLCGVCF